MGACFAHFRFFSTLFIFLAVFEACFVLCKSGSESESDETEVTGKDEEGSVERAWTKEKSKVEFSVFKTRDRNAPFEVDLQVFGEKHHLKLRRPESSVFAEGFKIDGREMRSDELEQVEDDIFVDNESMAVLQIYESSNATYCLRGWIKGVGIVARENCEMEAIRIQEKSQEGQNHDWCGVDKESLDESELEPQEAQSSQELRTSPSLDLDSEFSSSSNSSELRQNNDMGYIEDMIIYDKEAAREIADNDFTIEKYSAIFIKAVNIIWASMSSPKIQFIVVGARSLNDTEDQDLVKSNGVKIHKILKEVTTFRKKKGEKKLEPSDVLCLVSGRDTLSDEGKSGTAGLANRGEACKLSGNAVVRDTGGAFEGVKTMAHEVGHTMGCLHDFQITDKKRKTDCRTKKGAKNGYVMNYYSKSPDQFKFSPCSKEMIRTYVMGDGACIYNRTSKKEIKLDNVKFPGQETNLTQQCKANLDKLMAGKDKTQPYPDDYVEDCLKFKCTYLEAKTNKNHSYYYTATQGTKCLNSVIAGVCQNQECVAASNGAGGQAAQSINEQCEDEVKKINEEYLPVPTDDKYVTCEKKSYACFFNKPTNSKKKIKVRITPEDGSPCAFKNSYGICNPGKCDCVPKCYQ